MGFGNNRNQRNQQRKGRWSKGEDDLLKSLVVQYSVDDDIDWSILEQHFNGARDSKQIRERWVNHLSPSIKKRKFNDKEIKIIEDECAKHKFKWSKISKKIPNATPLMIKNFYNNRLKKKHPPIRRLGIITTHNTDTQTNICANVMNNNNNNNNDNNNNNNDNITKLIDNSNNNNNLTATNLIRNNGYLSPDNCYYNEHSLSRSSSVKTMVNDDNNVTTLSRNSSVRTMVNDDNYLTTSLPSPLPSPVPSSDFVKPTMQEMEENHDEKLHFLATVADIVSHTSESPSPTDSLIKRSKKMSISNILNVY